MKAVIQRSKNAKVLVNDEVTGEIDHGLVILLGVTHEDTDEDIEYLVHKIAHLRIFEDENEKMNLSLVDVNGSILSVSQFTLHADTRKGRRPSFVQAAKPEYAKKMYDTFNHQLRAMNIQVETGEFGAMMDVHLINDGPVTIVIDSKNK